MYEVREYDARIDHMPRVRLRTDDVADVVRHFEEEGFHYVGEISTGKAFANSVDGRTSVVKVVA